MRKPRYPMTDAKHVLVIGGGVAGLTAARDLARMGAGVLLVERQPFVGGHAARLTCKATDRCLKCNDCLVEQLLKEVSQEGGFKIRAGTEIRDLRRHGKTFEATLHSEPAYVDPRRCTLCGLCLQECPAAAQGAILTAPSHHLSPFYAIDPRRCTCSPDSEERPCQTVCPAGAIDLDAKAETCRVEARGVILATGYQPFDPAAHSRYGYDRHPNMITAMDLEEALRRDGEVLRPSDGTPPQNLAFVQCVGSRDRHIDRDYCSRVCCGYALRMALRILHAHPAIKITVFYMDIQNFGKDFHRTLEEARNKCRFLRGLPGNYNVSEDGRISLAFHDEERGKNVREDFDMVVLSVGISPSPSRFFFRDALSLGLNEDGFLEVPQGHQGQGIVLSGSAEGPMNVVESITHAKRAALEMARFLGLDSA